MQENRRNLLRALTLGGGAIGLSQLPSQWTRPVIESVTLPAHAQTTLGGFFGSGNFGAFFIDRGVEDRGLRFADRESGSWLDAAIPYAHAVEQELELAPVPVRYEAGLTADGTFLTLSLSFVPNLMIKRTGLYEKGSPLDAFVGPAYAGVEEIVNIKRCFSGFVYPDAFNGLDLANSSGCDEVPEFSSISAIVDNTSPERVDIILRFNNFGGQEHRISVFPGSGVVDCSCSGVYPEEEEDD